MSPRAALLASTLAAMALSGCIPPANPPEAAPPMSGNDQCGASRVQKYLGFVATDDLVATIQRESGAATIRRYTTGDPVTKDYRIDRLNVEVEANGRIAVLNCG